MRSSPLVRLDKIAAMVLTFAEEAMLSAG